MYMNFLQIRFEILVSLLVISVIVLPASDNEQAPDLEGRSTWD